MSPSQNVGMNCDVPSAEEKEKLIIALKELPQKERLEPEEFDELAYMISMASFGARYFESEAEKVPSQSSARSQLEQLWTHSNQLKNHLEMLDECVLNDLVACQVPNFYYLKHALKELERAAKEVEAELMENYRARGRPRNYAAAAVVAVAAESYCAVTGRKPSFTTDVETNEVLGDWPIFVESIFGILGISGQGARQARSYVQESKVR